MKRFKGFISVVLSIILFMNFNVIMVKGNITNEQPIVNQEEALTAYNNMINNFKSYDTGEIIYPDEYGGEYIDGDILVIQLVNKTSEMENYYLKLCNNSNKVIFKEVEYSLNYLYSLTKLVDTFKEDYNIISYGVDHKDNEFDIKVTYNEFSLFNNQLNMSEVGNYPIKIEVGEEIEMTSNVNGGDALDGDTITCGGTYNGMDAILLCGHSRRQVNDVVRDSYGNAIATVKRTSYTGNVSSDGQFWNTSMLGDYAIATMNAGYNSTRYIHISSTEYAPISTITSAPIGTNVYRYSKVTGSAFGTVTAVNQSVQYAPTSDGYKFYVSGLTETDMSIAPLPGDSGGPFYTHYSTYNIIGTLSGGNTVKKPNNRYTTYFSPISFATSNGFTPKYN